jgi:formylglycine-generating enzyme required for sulfatase activity
MSIVLVASGSAAVEPDAELKAADTARVAAMRAGDRAELDRLFSADLRYAHSNGTVDSKASFIDVLTSGKTKYLAYEYEERTFTRPVPGIALMTGRARIKAESNGGQMDSVLSFLAVWRQEQGQWRFLAWQSCRLPPAPPTVQGTTAVPITNSLGMKLVRIEPGTFTMGQDGPPVAGKGDMATHPAEFGSADWDEKPAHRVMITRPFAMAATEVTVAQYRRFDPDFGKQTPARRPADDEAVAGVTWTQAAAFCDWLSKQEGKPYRLPTEAEWEYACRAGTTTLFHTGDSLPPGHQKWFGGLGWRDLYFPTGSLPREYAWHDGPVSLRVGQATPNAWGLHDMHGNVAEWCLDWYGPYEAGDVVDPLGGRGGDHRVFRGGGHSELTRLIRSANRGGWIPDAPLPAVGFRVVLGERPSGTQAAAPIPPLHAREVSQQRSAIVKQPDDVPFMEGPRLYRQIPSGQVGPLFTRHNHSPGLTECPNGDLLAVWYSCISEPGPELCNAAARLRFGTKDWEPPSPFWDGPDINDHGPKLWWDGDRTLVHLSFIHNGQSICRTSTTNGATWSPATPLPVSGEWGNSIIRTRDGMLAISLDGASLVVSRDNGRTWNTTGKPRGRTDLRPGGTGPCVAGIHAPLVELADGRIMAVGRFDGVDDQERFGFRMPVSHTRDLGETWQYEASEFPVVSSTQRPVLLRLKEGPILLCSFTDQARDLKQGHGGKGLPFRCADGAFTGVGLFAAVSYDEGRTWPDRRLILGPGEPVTHANGMPPNTNGYLALIQARDGRLHLLTSSKHYAFNLAWLKTLPPAPTK